jgi:hypothetical protein
MIKQEMALSKDFHGFVVGRPKMYSKYRKTTCAIVSQVTFNMGMAK